MRQRTMYQVDRIRHAIKVGVENLLQRSGYRPTYRESSYRRSMIWRLTPLARYIFIVVCVILVALMGVMANQSIAARSGDVLLSDQLTAQPLPTHPVTPVIVMADQVTNDLTPTPAQANAAEPRLTSTPDLSRAPWAGQLFKQPDGTLMAPQKLIAQVTFDLGGWYLVQRDLPIDEWLNRRDEILNTYFAGDALPQMQTVEKSRDLYAMNRAGRFSMEIRRFSPDGYTAKAGIITRDWVSDVYDVQTKQLIARGQIKRDTLTIWSIAYDQLSGHWKFTHTDEVIELTP